MSGDPAALPPPDPEAAALSTRLTDLVRERIAAAGGAITFADYMGLALYAPGLGYYSAGSRKFGPAGDFVTAPELSPLFAHCLARQLAEVLAELGGGELLEFGAGSGRLAVDLLLELERLGALPERYLILEVSAELQARQRETLAALPASFAGRVVWLDRLPASGFRGVVVANEVLDAMPVHRFRLAAGGVEEGGVGWDGAALADRWLAPPLTEGLAERVAAALAEAGGGQPPGYASEINLQLDGWIAALGAVLEAGLVLLVDYGFPAREYYHPQRTTGTLMAHYRHRAHGDPYHLPGLQDLTAHVDFTAVAEAAVKAGLDVLGYTSQSAFLLALGITEEAARAAGPREQLQASQALNRLLSPAEMGELFKVIALGRGLEQPLRGFALQDRRGRL